MTFDTIVSEVASRLNLSSTEATIRLGLFVNARYRRVTSSTGLATSRRATVSESTISTDPRVVFDLEKIEVVYHLETAGRRVLEEISYDEYRNIAASATLSGIPTTYAIENSGAATVELVLTPTPSSVITLYADGLAPAATLATTDVPAFPVDFHDALVFGAIADEYSKLEKPVQALKFERDYEARVSDLRYFLAKSAYLSQVQNSRGRTNRNPTNITLVP